MPKSNNVDRKNGKLEYRYWPVTITHSERETSGRGFKDHNKAEADPKKIVFGFFHRFANTQTEDSLIGKVNKE